MNRLITKYYPMFELYQALRSQLMGILTDEQLDFRPASNNESLAELCLDIGHTQTAYIDSFRTFRMSFENKGPAPDPTVAALRSWYNQLDAELRQVIAGLTDETISSRKIYRGENFELLPNIQLDVYKEALLIFYGKVSVYLKCMEIELPEQWREWIG
jgi:uncharacterized damage-inducible protein DinB